MQRLRLLAAHFLRRFLDNDLISPGGDSHVGITHALAAVLVASLMVFVTVCLKYSQFRLTWADVADRSFEDAAFYVAVSMIVFGLAASLSWDAFYLDARDQVVLGILPVAPRLLTAAKLAALGAFLVALIVAANLVPVLFAPALMLRGVREATFVHWAMLTRAHAAASIGAGVWTVLVVVALRGVVGCSLPARTLRRTAPLIQAALVLGFVGWLVLLPQFLRQARAVWFAGGWTRDALPPFWFIGLHRVLIGWPDAAGRPLARTALLALAGVATAVLVLHIAWPPRRQFVKDTVSELPIGSPSVARRGREALVARLFASSAVAHAVFEYTLRGFRRSAVHRLYLAAAAGTGLAWAVGAVLSSGVGGSANTWTTPSAATLQVQLLLTMFTVAAVRLGVGMPIALGANWVFRVTERQPTAAYHAGTRWAACVMGAWPVIVLAPLDGWLWGWPVALYHALTGLCYTACIVQMLFVGTTAVPFAAPHVSGSLRLKTRWPIYLFAPSILGGAPAFVEYRLLHAGWPALALPAVFAGAAVVIALERRRRETERRGLIFEEPPLDALQTLAIFD